MLKKTITYTDFNGDERTEDFYFNLSKAELVEMELSTKGGLVEDLQKVIADGEGKVIIATFKDILAKAYGIRSEDGRRFIKSAQISEEFEQTAAYSQLFVELVTEADKSAAFITGVVPPDLAEKAAQAQQSSGPRAPQDRLPKQASLPTETQQAPSAQPGDSFVTRPPHESGPSAQAPNGGLFGSLSPSPSEGEDRPEHRYPYGQ